MTGICKRILSILVTIMSPFCTTEVLFAAESPAIAGSFILPEDVRAPAEQIFRDAESGIDAMNAFLNGTIGAYVTDLDNDGKQEIIDVYLRSIEASNTQQIRVGLYENDSAGNTVLRQEFMFSEFHASLIFDYDFKLSYFESDAGKYLISNEILFAGAGISSTAHVITLDDDNMLYAPISLRDPGATSAIELYRFDNMPTAQLSQIGSTEGTGLYVWSAGDSGELDSQQYYQKLNQALAPYGTQATISPLNGGFLSDTPYIIQGETAVIAELNVDRNYQTKVFHVKYSGSNPFGDNHVPETQPFRPEIFYRKILNELRPKYADGFCFLDMDCDGREELLIGGSNIEFADQIIAVYTCKENSSQPIELFSQFPTSFNYGVSSDGFVTYNPSPNQHGQSYGKVIYQISNGQLVPVQGYLADSQTGKYYQTDNKELLMLPLSYDFSGWDVISYDAFYQAIDGISIEPFQPNMTAFAEYDRQQEFNPESYYQRILNADRPSYATDFHGNAAGYRFLDLDGDGKEELLLCGGSLNNVWAPIRAVYSYDAQSDTPRFVDLILDRVHASYTNGIGSTVRYSSNYDLLPMSVQVLYSFSGGEIVPICGIAEKDESERVFYTENAEMLAELGQYDYIEWDVGTQSDSKVLEMKALFDQTHDMNPYLYSFIDYDAEREYLQKHPEHPIPVSGASGYDALLRKLRGIAAAPDRIAYEAQGTSCLSTDDFSHLWIEYDKQGNLTDPCYVMRDLNGDGIQELAVGNRAQDGTFELFDLYTIDNGEIVHLASSGMRDRFSLGAENEIIENRFSNAASGITIAYTLKNGKLEPLRALQNDRELFYSLENGGTPAESWENITLSDYDARGQTEYPVQQNPEMVSLLTRNRGAALSGDFSGDGAVSVADAVLLARFVAEDETLTDSQTNMILNDQPDQNADGIVTMMDVVCILRIIQLAVQA